ncbi:hypothetical protein ACQ4M4_06125 [Leptolyngbya sp. AN02str]|uniref:hypothetical protein n=1 Tax=Leptolyngbya sp. AN02str TaxID=3423363 RepID=UPI003D30F474
MSSQLNPDLHQSSTQKPTLFDHIFRDQNGRIVIAQPPNLPVLVSSTATILQFVLPVGKLQTACTLIAFGGWFTWSWLEIFDGVNYFRRGLGLLVLSGILALGISLVNG